MAAYIGSLLVSVCVCVALFGSRQTDGLTDDGVTVTPKHVGAVLM